LFMFQQVAQERNEDLKTWTARIRDVKELKPLVDQITAASEQLGKPSQTQPANEPPGPARSTGPE